MFGSFISAKCESLLTQIESYVRVRKGPWSRRVQAGEVKLSALLLCWSVSKMCISFWHSNLPYFKKSISVDNECKCQILTLEYIYIYLYIYTHPRLSSLSSTTGTLQTFDRNSTGTFPTTTNINAQSSNDNNPVNHQPIRHSKRLEFQRRMSELYIS